MLKKIGILFGIFFLCFLLYLAYGNFYVSLGKIQPKIEGEDIVFYIDYKKTRGLLDLTVTDVSENKVVWDINLSYYYGQELRYGEVPLEFKTNNGVTNRARQKIPEVGVPPELEKGKIYKLVTDWQYDAYFNALSANTELFFKIEDGRIIIWKRCFVRAIE